MSTKGQKKANKQTSRQKDRRQKDRRTKTSSHPSRQKD
ncbi:uncharacterized protein LOC143282550, partial [Babylonia areolata]